MLLSIAGFDPSSGAGVSADLKTAAAHGYFAIACITALTVQSTQGVARVVPVDPEIVHETLERLAKDFELAAIRIGMLGSGAVATVVADFIDSLGQDRSPVVVLDPILRASSGAALVDEAGVEILRSRLLAVADVITPNHREAQILAGLAEESDFRAAAGALHRMGAANVVVTGGELDPPRDLLSIANPLTATRQIELTYARVESAATHGTGCAFATSLACELGAGVELEEAVRLAHNYVAGAIKAAQPLGRGHGPLHHLYRLG